MTSLTSVLIVDDEEPIRELLARWVQSLNLQACLASTAEEAVATLNAQHCDLAIIDIMMPGKNGLWLADELRRNHPDVAVVLSTGNAAMIDNTPPPIADLLIKPYKRERFVLAVDRGREWRRQAVEELERQAHLRRSSRAILDVQSEVERAQGGTRRIGCPVADRGSAHIPEVVEHSERVERYTASIARELDVDPDRRCSSARLDFTISASWRYRIRACQTLSADSLRDRHHASPRRGRGRHPVGHLTAQRTAPIVMASHEWFDGQGYPAGLRGDAIPLASRIIAVADAYDAMTQDRRYRRRLDAVEAVSELLRGASTQFDPDVVVAFLNIVNRH